MTKVGIEEPLVKEIFIECRPETLFPFFTDPGKMVRWLGSQVLLEPRIGGSFRVDFNSNDTVNGKYIEVIPYTKVVFSWGWVGSDIFPPGLSTVEFTLQEQDKGTLLTLKHAGVPTANRDTHGRGWAYYMARLVLAVQGQDPGPDTFAVTTHGIGARIKLADSSPNEGE